MRTLLLSTTMLTLATGAALAQEGEPRYGTFGFDVEGMNTEIDPGDDFYEYANGTWLDATEIPSDRSNYGMFTVLSIEADEDVQVIVREAAAEDAEDGTNSQMVGDLFESWMDADAINARGLEPARPYLDRIAQIETHEDAAAMFATVHYAAPWAAGVLPDPADTSRYTVAMSQAGLGMPDRDYYLNEEERFAEFRQAYVDYIARIFELAGIEGGDEKAAAILEFETALAEVHWSQERQRDIQAIYNVMTPDEVAALAPNLDLVDGLDQLGLGGVDSYMVTTPSAISESAEIVANTDIALIKDWMTFHFISDRAAWLGEDFDAANFAFFSTTLNGIEEPRPRDERGVELIGNQLGHAIGQIYVDRHFPPSSKEQMEGLVGNLTSAFRVRLEDLAWMDEETREQALLKLSTFEPRIGYPEIWDDFSGLEVDASDYFGNRMRLAEFQWQDQVEDLAGPVDRREWGWPPQIVNASYNPLLNQITFPAGILQPPFFDPAADPAINYGGIGAVIGHEIGHGFDDQGRRFDHQGRIRDWWTEETNARFEERADAFGAQYAQYCPIEDQCVNPNLTMGENIGDLGGMEMAYSAWRDFAEANYENGEAPVINGFTGDQRFFLAWAQVWRRLYRDDNLRQRLVTDPHSPSEYRTNGIVRNIDAWYAAFDVEEGDELYLPPEERVSIW
ncbi:zinc metalloprotease [Marinicauda pacifica]|uniref:M13 family peptidase n=1 Tax=Marinicauda pacifica TaxID=1133559 RepID=A0A4S2HDF4_9PROT|nr:M13 family metallopeptidase [Marinicauda pacifica]TGY94024.1 M13 family peptidase [Marinicauda pacifica]GGE32199.1 zinc metalloprotease [Marinicauda pacifica]